MRDPKGLTISVVEITVRWVAEFKQYRASLRVDDESMSTFRDTVPEALAWADLELWRIRPALEKP